MGSLKLSGATSGHVEIAAPAVAGTQTIEFPTDVVQKSELEWTSYTPTWTATGGSPTIGNGTLSGRYLTAGDLCHFTMYLAIGSTTSVAGTSAWTFTAPTPTANWVGAFFDWVAYDTSAFTAAYGAAPIGGGVSDFQCYNVGVAQSLGASIPFTWATGDYLVVRGTYEC